MNYEGQVSSVNTVLWTFELDNKITVHLGHLAAHNLQQFLPEIGEHMQVYNAHYMINRQDKVKKLFLCERSVLKIDRYKAYAREEELLKLIIDCDLGVSDLLEIDYNITAVNDSIAALIQESSEKILFEVIRSIEKSHKPILKNCNNAHKCLNRIIPPFTLKTISNCRYIDLQPTKGIKGPPWSFGTHSKLDKSTMLLGYIQINKRFGLVLLHDMTHTMPCLITSQSKCGDKNSILNKVVLITEYRVFTETHREFGSPNLEYILFDVEHVIVLNVTPRNTVSQEILIEELPDGFPYVYNFEFKLEKKAAVSISSESKIECWLEVLIRNNNRNYCSYLGLNAYQVQIVPFLKENETYRVYHSEKLKHWKNFELSRIKAHPVSRKFMEKTAVFVCGRTKSTEFANPLLCVTQAIEKIKESNESISFQGLISVKKLTPALSSRTQQKVKCAGFGTPGTRTHSLIFIDNTQENELLLYLNNWENLQIPLGLIPHMRVCVKNALPQKNKYLKSSPITTFEVLSYEPPVFFDTANLRSDLARECEKYSFLGWGDLIPCSVLIWARIVQLHIRSLKIMSKCEVCDVVVLAQKECSCGSQKRILDTSITLFVQDQMGQALVISKSTELLRLLLDLEPLQWSIWCLAFEMVGEYVHDNEQTMLFSKVSNVNVFCEALALTVNAVNIMKISNLELKCRKMESNRDDNDGMSTWFCVDARRREQDVVL